MTILSLAKVVPTTLSSLMGTMVGVFAPSITIAYAKGDKKELSYIENMFISVGRPYNVKVTVKGVEKNIVAKRRKMNIPLDSL